MSNQKVNSTLKPNTLSKTKPFSDRNTEYIQQLSQQSKIKKEQQAELEQSKENLLAKGFSSNVNGANAAKPKTPLLNRSQNKWTTQVDTEVLRNISNVPEQKIQYNDESIQPVKQVNVDYLVHSYYEECEQQNETLKPNLVADCDQIQEVETDIISMETQRNQPSIEFSLEPANQSRIPIFDESIRPQQTQKQTLKQSADLTSLQNLVQENEQQDEALYILQNKQQKLETMMQRESLRMVQLPQDGSHLAPDVIPESLFMLVDEIQQMERVDCQREQRKSSESGIGEDELPMATLGAPDEKPKQNKPTEFMFEEYEDLQQNEQAEEPHPAQVLGNAEEQKQTDFFFGTCDEMQSMKVEQNTQKQQPQIQQVSNLEFDQSLRNKMSITREQLKETDIIDFQKTQKQSLPPSMFQVDDGELQIEVPHAEVTSKKQKRTKKKKELAPEEEKEREMRASNLFQSIRASGMDVNQIAYRILNLDDENKRLLLHVLTQVEKGDVSALQDISLYAEQKIEGDDLNHVIKGEKLPTRSARIKGKKITKSTISIPEKPPTLPQIKK